MNFHLHRPHHAHAHMHKSIDMTQGNIALQFLLFAAPLLAGDILQQLYNTVDSIIVGNFVGKQALAAVGATGGVVNMLVGLFIGISTGATVVISRRFGAKDKDGLRRSVQTTIWLTLLMGVAFTVIGILMTPAMLRILATPDDVMPVATEYLTIYFGGISGLIMYNMCSGILRAIGDSQRPLYVLVFSSVLNIALDLLFIIPMSMGVAGAAIATIISQFLSAGVLLVMLHRTEEFAPLGLHRPVFEKEALSVIFGVGLPFGLQRSIVSFSNNIVLSYVNRFGSGAMAAWGVQSKIDHIIFQTMQSMGAATTTFVAQNVGAKKLDRIKKGIATSMLLTMAIVAVYALIFVTFRRQLVGLFNNEEDVIYYGSIALMIFPPLNIINTVAQIKSAVLRGYGNGKTPMLISLFCYVVIRQIYLHLLWPHFQSFEFILMSFPFTWVISAAMMYLYDHFSPRMRRIRREAAM